MFTWVAWQIVTKASEKAESPSSATPLSTFNNTMQEVQSTAFLRAARMSSMTVAEASRHMLSRRMSLERINIGLEGNMENTGNSRATVSHYT